MIDRILPIFAGFGLAAEYKLMEFPFLHAPVFVEFVEVQQILVDSLCAVGVFAIGDGIGVVLLFKAGFKSNAGHLAEVVVG